MQTKTKRTAKNGIKSVLTSETLGVIIMLFTTLCTVCLISGDKIFSAPGGYVSAFLCGTFGYFSVPLCLYLFGLGLFMLIGKKLTITKKRRIILFFLLLFTAFLTHVATMHAYVSANPNGSYGDYLVQSYAMGETGLIACSGGGIVSALLCYFITVLLTLTGSYVVLGIAVGVFAYLLIKDISDKKNVRQKDMKSSFVSPERKDNLEVKEYPIDGVEFQDYPKKAKQGLFVVNADDFAVKNKREMKQEETSYVFENVNGINIVTSMINHSEPKTAKSDILGSGNVNNTYSGGYSEEMMQKMNYIRTPAEINVSKNEYPFANVSGNVAESVKDERPTVSAPIERQPEIPFVEHDETVEDTAESRAESFSRRYAEIEDTEEKSVSPVEVSKESGENQKRDAFDIFREREMKSEPAEETKETSDTGDGLDIAGISEESRTERYEDYIYGEKKDGDEDAFKPTRGIEQPKEDTESRAFIDRAVIDGNKEPSPSNARDFFSRDREVETETSGRDFGFETPSRTPINSEMHRTIERQIQKPVEEPVKEEPPKKVIPINREYFRPPLDLLERRVNTATASEEDHAGRMEKIKSTLEEFKIEVEPVDYIQGPTITRYEIKMPFGVPVKRVLSYDDHLKMRLQVEKGVRILAPIPGKDMVGIEVENKHKEMVGIREVMEDLAKEPTKPNQLIFAIGKDVVGKTVSDNLAKGPHYLIAGQTGSGKSVCLNTLIVSLIMRYSPEELRLILVDPKLVEFRNYEHIPHLYIDEILSDPPKVLAALQWAYDETERRNLIFKNCEEMIVNIEGYNKTRKPDEAKMPRIVIVIDELADLMETCKKDFESKIRAIAQKSRSAGIHLVLATQRPSVDIITGTIKANLPSRIAFRVMTYNDSQTILGTQGAEKLLGNGDMLYMNSTSPECQRYQGAFISAEEINAVVKYIIKNNPAYFDDEMKEYLEKAVRPKQEEVSVSDEEGGVSDADEDLIKKATLLAIQAGSVSVSALQRRFSLGWPKAGKIIDKMYMLGYISGNDGSKARKVLITLSEFEEKYGPASDIRY